MNKHHFTVKIDSTKRRIYFSYFGRVTFDGSVSAIDILINSEGYDRTFDAIMDFTQASEIDITFYELKKISTIFNEKVGRTGSTAYVTGLNHGRHIYAQFFCAVRGAMTPKSVKFKAFKYVEEAEDWLDCIGAKK